MIKIGDKVQCRFFNTPDGKFYGEYFTGEIVDIDKCYFNWPYSVKGENGYLVRSESRPSDVWLHRKEIKRILTEA